MGEHGGQADRPAALAPQGPLVGRSRLCVTGERLTRVALAPGGAAAGLVRQRMQDTLPTGAGQRAGALGSGEGLLMGAHEGAMACEKARDLAQPRRGVEAHREGLRLTQTRQDTPWVASRLERRAQGQLEVQGPLARGARCRQMLQRTQRRLDIPPAARCAACAMALALRPPGRRAGLGPTPPPAAPGRPGVRSGRPPECRRARRGPRHCAHATAAGAPGAASQRPRQEGGRAGRDPPARERGASPRAAPRLADGRARAAGRLRAARLWPAAGGAGRRGP
jgi:hypothetical protein